MKTQKKKNLFDIKDTITLGDGTKCCSPHYFPHAIPLIQKPVADEQCYTHSAVFHRMHHNLFYKALRCPHYEFMMKGTEQILAESI